MFCGYCYSFYLCLENSEECSRAGPTQLTCDMLLENADEDMCCEMFVDAARVWM